MESSDICPKAFFCAELARQHCEPIYGTASRFQFLYLLEYDAAWGAKPFVDSTIDPAVKAHLSAQVQAIGNGRILFVKQAEKTDNKINLFIVCAHPVTPYYNHIQLNDYADLLNLDLAASLERCATSKIDPLYMVCTNGNKDKCCAKFGMACYKELLKHIPAQRLWQCAHVGGDRFAPNIVTAPSGAYFGGMPMDHVPALVAGIENNQIDLTYYRGRPWYAKHIQSAEYFARVEWDNQNFYDLEVVDQNVTDQTAHVTFREISTGRVIAVDLVLEVSAYESFLSCNDKTQSRAEFYTLVRLKGL